MSSSTVDETARTLESTQEASTSEKPAVPYDDKPPNDGDSTTTSAESATLPPLCASWREDLLNRTERDKVQQILRACKDGNVVALQQLATSPNGLVEDEVRRTAWPVLLGCVSPSLLRPNDWRALARHRDEDQVQLDVNRSFVYYPEDEPEKRKDARKHELSDVITAVLRQHPMLHYFQGYHDIVQVLLLVLGAEAAVPAVARLSLLRIRDFMLPTMAGTEPHLQLLPTILYAVDPVLCQHLRHTQPFFALAATLTLYAHDIEEYGSIARLFDYLLASEAVIPIYLYAVIVMSRRDELLDIEEDEPEMLFAILSKLPKPLNLEALITRTSELYSLYPPQKLPGPAWSRVSTNSVLKTTRKLDALAKQTLQDGETFFHQQAAEIKRAEDWKRRKSQMRQLGKRYKTPATLVGTSFMVLLAAYWMRSGVLPSGLTGLFPARSAFKDRVTSLLTAWTY